jgi:hypothetical protein
MKNLFYIGFVLFLFACSSKKKLPVTEIFKIREIGELFTTDSYKSNLDYVTGNVWKLHDLYNFQDIFSESDITRCFTLITKVEAKIGFRLTDKNYRVAQNKDTVWFHFPSPEILDFNSNPSETEVFKENWNWDNQARI